MRVCSQMKKTTKFTNQNTDSYQRMNNYLRTYDPGYTSCHYDETISILLPNISRTTSLEIRFLQGLQICGTVCHCNSLKSCTSISVFSSRLRKMYKERPLSYGPPGCS